MVVVGERLGVLPSKLIKTVPGDRLIPSKLFLRLRMDGELIDDSFPKLAFRASEDESFDRKLDVRSTMPGCH